MQTIVFPRARFEFGCAVHFGKALVIGVGAVCSNLPDKEQDAGHAGWKKSLTGILTRQLTEYTLCVYQNRYVQDKSEITGPSTTIGRSSIPS